MESAHPDWRAAITVASPNRKARPPYIHVGPVASGDKVVDDLSDPLFEQVSAAWPGLLAVEMEGLGAAEAIRNMRERGHSLNFSMVRGISDIPRPGGSRRASGAGSRSSQTRERDRWKTFASEVAAVLVVQMIRMAWQRPPREE
jgi:nucleoside phosphorylase